MTKNLFLQIPLKGSSVSPREAGHQQVLPPQIHVSETKLEARAAQGWDIPFCIQFPLTGWNFYTRHSRLETGTPITLISVWLWGGRFHTQRSKTWKETSAPDQLLAHRTRLSTWEKGPPAPAPSSGVAAQRASQRERQATTIERSEALPRWVKFWGQNLGKFQPKGTLKNRGDLVASNYKLVVPCERQAKCSQLIY